MLALLSRRPGLRRLWLAGVVSMLGDWLTYVAVGVLAARSGEGLHDVALVQLAHTLPQVATAPLAGWLSDRVDRRRLMVVASVGRGLLSLAMAGAAHAGAIGAMEVLLVLRMAGASFVTTPTSALLPRLVERDEIAEANAALGLTWAIVFSIGAGLGGVLNAAIGPVVAIAGDSLSFFAAAAILGALVVPPADPGERRTVGGSLVEDARAHPQRARVALLKTPSQMANGAAFIAMHALVAAMPLEAAALTLGSMHALRGLGNGLAPVVLRRRVGSAAMAAIGSAFTIAAALVLAASWSLGAPTELAHPSVAIALLAALVWGAGIGSSWVGGGATLQRAIPDAVLGRYSALDLGSAAVASALGGISCAALATTWSPPIALPSIALVAASLALAVHRGVRA